MIQPQLSSIGPSSPWPKAKVEVEAPSPLVVEVAAPKEELLLNVKVVISLLGAWNEWNTVDAIAPSETLHRVTFVHEGSSALAQNFFLAGVRARPLVPNPTLRATLLQQQHVEQGEDEPELVKTIQAGREFDSSVQVHSVMDAQKRLASKAMSSDERVGLLNEPRPRLWTRRLRLRLSFRSLPHIAPPKSLVFFCATTFFRLKSLIFFSTPSISPPASGIPPLGGTRGILATS